MASWGLVEGGSSVEKDLHRILGLLRHPPPSLDSDAASPLRPSSLQPSAAAPPIRLAEHAAAMLEPAKACEGSGANLSESKRQPQAQQGHEGAHGTSTAGNAPCALSTSALCNIVKAYLVSSGAEGQAIP